MIAFVITISVTWAWLWVLLGWLAIGILLDLPQCWIYQRYALNTRPKSFWKWWADNHFRKSYFLWAPVQYALWPYTSYIVLEDVFKAIRSKRRRRKAVEEYNRTREEEAA